jgi:hypothetical protein
MSIRAIAALLLLTACAAEKQPDAAAPAAETAAATQTVATTETVATTQTVATTTEEAEAPGTWAGQIKVGQPVSMFNYVGAESGDFAPMRFRNDSEAGKKILAACSDDDMCEFKGVVEWLDEPPPENASAIGQIVRVDSVKRLPPPAR